MVLIWGMAVRGSAQNQCGILDQGSTSEEGMGSIHRDGVAYNWGDNSVGQLGNGTNTNSAFAVPVLKGQYAGTVYFGDDINNKAISIVTSDRGRFALTADGIVYTWGSNGDGQLGIGSTSSSTSTTPLKVLKGQYPGTTYLGDAATNKIVALIAGDFRYYALAQNGRVYAWGDNGSKFGYTSLLGDGTNTQRTSPITVLKGQYSGTTYLGDNAANIITKIAANARSASGLGQDGLVYAWGTGNSGQMGDGANTARNTPVKVWKGQYPGTTYLGDVSTNKVMAITMGSETSYALTQDGALYAWGLNSLGEIGNNSSSNTNTPVRVLKGQYNGTTYLGDNTLDPIFKIAASDYHMLVICADGLVYSWGWNNNGQLGDGTETDRSTAVKVLKGNFYPGTTYLGDNPSYPALEIAGGGSGSVNYSVYMTGGDCKVYGAGYNGAGELGNGTFNNSSIPVPSQVNGGCGSKMGLLSVSNGTSLLMDGVGILYSWGLNGNGQLGNGTLVNSSSPVKVLKGQYYGTNYFGDIATDPIQKAAGGDLFTLALDKNGQVYSFGDNTSGQLGNNSNTQTQTPVRVWTGQYPGSVYLGDDSQNKIAGLAAGSSSSYALGGNGMVYSWGSNVSGQLGDASNTARTTPVRVRKGEYAGTTYLGDVTSTSIVSIVAGQSTAAGLSGNGTVYTWGSNSDGQLGNSSLANSNTPVRVRKGTYTGTTYLGDNAVNPIVAIAAGGLSFYALDALGVVYSWGDNSNGQLGENTNLDRSTPVRVQKGQYSGTLFLGDNSLNKIVKIRGGNQHGIAVDANGVAYGWGRNIEGQLGDGTNTSKSTPMKVLKGAYSSGTTYLGDNPAMKIGDVLGSDLSTVYVTTDCSIYGTGNNASGQLGTGTFSSSNLPVRGITPVTDLTLPITLTVFEAYQKGQNVEIGWQTASEVNSYAMEVERRVGQDGPWTMVGLPVSGHGTTNQGYRYGQTDDVRGLLAQGSVTVYYRLKSIDLDGSYGYSVMREVSLSPVNDRMNLSQNVPNPFGRMTQIGYTLSEPGQVELSLYNQLGQRVDVLQSGIQAAGDHQVKYDGVNLMAGVYYYRLSYNGEVIQSRRMTISR